MKNETRSNMKINGDNKDEQIGGFGVVRTGIPFKSGKRGRAKEFFNPHSPYYYAKSYTNLCN